MEDTYSLDAPGSQLQSVGTYKAVVFAALPADLRKNLGDLDDGLDDLNGQIETALVNLGNVAKAGLATPYEATELQGEAGIAAPLNDNAGNISDTLSEMRKLQAATNEIIKITDDLIDETDNLNYTANSYSDDLIDLLERCKDLTRLLNTSIDSTVTFLTYTKALLETSGDLLDLAAKTSLQGSSDVLEKSIIGLGSIPTMRNANDPLRALSTKN